MTSARRLFYLHLLIAGACIAFALYGLNRQVIGDSTFDRRLEVLFSWTAFKVMWLACVVASVVLPFAVGYMTVGRLSSWRWWPMVAVTFVLGWIQYIALIVMVPVRY